MKVLLSEVENFAEGISRAGVMPVGILTPRQYARSIRDGFDPWGREARQRLGVIDADRADVAPGRMGPLADQGAWNRWVLRPGPARPCWRLRLPARPRRPRPTLRRSPVQLRHRPQLKHPPRHLPRLRSAPGMHPMVRMAHSFQRQNRRYFRPRLPDAPCGSA